MELQAGTATAYDDVRDELARRKGWNKPGTFPASTGNELLDALNRTIARGCWWKVSANGTLEHTHTHPFPATLDGADSAVPDGYYWTRSAYSWFGSKIPFGAEVHIPDTGDKVADLYRVALACAVEQDGTHGTDGTDGAKGGG